MELNINDIIKLNHLKVNNINGIDFYYHKDTRFKKCYLKVETYFPFDVNNILYYLALVNIMSKSSKKYPKEEDFQYVLDDLYGSTYSVSNRLLNNTMVFQFDCYFISPIYVGEKDYFTKILSFFNDSIQNPDFDERKFKYIVNDMKHSYNNILRNPNTIANNGFYKSMYQGEQSIDYLKINSESYDQLELSKLIDVYHQVRQGISVMYLTGDINYQMVLKTIKNFDFSFLNPYNMNNDLNFENNELNIKSNTLIKRDYYNSNQGILYVGYKSPIDFHLEYKKRIATILFNMMLGEYFGSDLNMIIREKYGLCYSISSTFYYDRHAIHINTTINRENYDRVVNEIMIIINKYQTGKITKKLLNKCKKLYRSDIKSYKDSPNECFTKITSLYRKFIIHSIKDFDDTLNSITINDIKDVASTFTLDTIYFMDNKKE